jgi:hypothetical protein
MNINPEITQIPEIATKTRRLVTISGYLRGFAIYKYRSTVIARSVKTEANSNAQMVERLSLQNNSWSPLIFDIVCINSMIHIG